MFILKKGHQPGVYVPLSTFSSFFLILFTGAVPKMPKADELKFKTKPDGYVSVDLTNELHHYHAYAINCDFYDYKN